MDKYEEKLNYYKELLENEKNQTDELCLEAVRFNG